jgi:hypothetical protein
VIAEIPHRDGGNGDWCAIFSMATYQAAEAASISPGDWSSNGCMAGF